MGNLRYRVAISSTPQCPQSFEVDVECGRGGKRVKRALRPPCLLVSLAQNSLRTEGTSISIRPGLGPSNNGNPLVFVVIFDLRSPVSWGSESNFSPSPNPPQPETQTKRQIIVSKGWRCQAAHQLDEPQTLFRPSASPEHQTPLPITVSHQAAIISSINTSSTTVYSTIGSRYTPDHNPEPPAENPRLLRNPAERVPRLDATPPHWWLSTSYERAYGPEMISSLMRVSLGISSDVDSCGFAFAVFCSGFGFADAE